VAAAETAWTIRERYADAVPPGHRIASRRSSGISATVSATYRAEVDALELTARAIGR